MMVYLVDYPIQMHVGWIANNYKKKELAENVFIHIFVCWLVRQISALFKRTWMRLVDSFLARHTPPLMLTRLTISPSALRHASQSFRQVHLLGSCGAPGFCLVH